MSRERKIDTQTAAMEAASAATDVFWCKPVLAGDESLEGFTSHEGFPRTPASEERDEGPQRSPSQAERATRHGDPAETSVAFGGSYTCRAQRRAFKYEGSWTMSRGMIHWAATILLLSSLYEARGSVSEDRPARVAGAVRHSIEQWIEAFSSGQASSR